jgi:di/tricarboxylate transporter
VELGTLIYFAGLFVLLKALEELGVVQFIAEHTASLIGYFPAGNTIHAVSLPHHTMSFVGH